MDTRTKDRNHDRGLLIIEAVDGNMGPFPKRRRLSVDVDNDRPNPDSTAKPGQLTPRSLNHPVSPPRKRSRQYVFQPESNEQNEQHQIKPATSELTDGSWPTIVANETFSSPFQLTWIRDLPDAANTDAVTLRDILGDPLIAECWEFNYLHDIDFLISHFEEDIRHLVQIHVVHGFWKKEDTSRLMLLVSSTLPPPDLPNGLDGITVLHAGPTFADRSLRSKLRDTKM